MAFVNKENATKCSDAFACKLGAGYYPKDNLTNHSDDFQGGYEDLAHRSFVQFINSASYALMQIRRGECLNEDYHGY